MHVGEGDGAGLLGWAVDGWGLGVADGAWEEAVGAAEDGLPLGRAPALDLAGLGEPEALRPAAEAEGTAVASSVPGCWSSVGVGTGVRASPDCGEASDSTPAPPTASMAAVRASVRRRFLGLRLLRRVWAARGRGSASGRRTAAEAGAPQPGHDSAPLRWRWQGAQ
ncbi:hypothetical protein GCM10010193_07870 [Kitasatospora atroaurantiaca]